MADFNIKGSVAFITGASSGIGKEICVALAKEGVHICAVGRNEKVFSLRKILFLTSYNRN